MIQHGPARARRSGRVLQGTPATTKTISEQGEWGLRLAWALAGIALLSVVGNIASLLAVLAAMGHAGPPQGPVTYLPVLAGSVIGLVGAAMLLSGAGGVLRPGLPFTSGRGMVIAGLVLELVAAAAVGTLEASWLITVVYLLLLVGLAVLWVRCAPPVGPRPLAQHPEAPPRRRSNITPSGRWTVPSSQRPIEWLGGVPPPPSAPSSAGEDLERQPSEPNTWTRH